MTDPGLFSPPGGTPPRNPSAPFAAPYTPAPRGSMRPAAPANRSRTPGIVALVVGAIATIGAALLAALATFRIAEGAGREIAARPAGADLDLSILTPVRDWVLTGEIAFWVGTALGVWAVVQGVIAAFADRGRTPGVAGAAIAAAGPVLFATVVVAVFGMTVGSGVSLGP